MPPHELGWGHDGGEEASTYRGQMIRLTHPNFRRNMDLLVIAHKTYLIRVSTTGIELGAKLLLNALAVGEKVGG